MNRIDRSVWRATPGAWGAASEAASAAAGQGRACRRKLHAASSILGGLAAPALRWQPAAVGARLSNGPGYSD